MKTQLWTQNESFPRDIYFEIIKLIADGNEIVSVVPTRYYKSNDLFLKEAVIIYKPQTP